MTEIPDVNAEITYEASKLSPERQDFFWQMVIDGQKPRFALMCAAQQPPGAGNTDRTFNYERRDNMNSMPDAQRNMLLARAKAAGVNTNGKFFVGSLGAATDPEAWVSTIDDAKDTCKRKNLNAEGLVNHKATPQPPPQKKAMADDVLDGYVKHYTAQDPSLKTRVARNPSALRELKQAVISKHSRPPS